MGLSGAPDQEAGLQETRGVTVTSPDTPIPIFLSPSPSSRGPTVPPPQPTGR